MKKKTIKQRNIELLEAKGWREDTTTRVTRYTVYSKPGVDYHYYLGRSGACRRGRTVGESISVKLKINGPDNEKRPTFDEAMAAIRSDKAEGEHRPDPTATTELTSAPASLKPTATSSTSPLAAVLQASIDRQRKAPDAPHVEVQALAGTGKTTTAIEGIGEAKGVRSGLTPSDQQRAVWDAIRADRTDTIRVSSFASKITDELKARIEAKGLAKLGVEARGIHSLGLAAATKRFGRLDASKAKWVVPDLCCELLGRDLRSMKGPELEVVWDADSLVSLCKQTLTEPTPENLDVLCSRYDVDLNGGRERTFELVPRILERCKTPAGGRITFDDMIWLPLVHDLPIFKVDLQIVDESQDLNRMQQELIYRAGHRILFVGDRRQAIYGFAGADAESMDRMRRRLGADYEIPLSASNPGKLTCKVAGPGCITLPLTVTRRCGKAIVEEARKWVPEYQAHESNPEGRVTRAALDEGQLEQYRKQAQDGDMVLCRVNAPLVSQCFRFIKEGRKANILGKKIGEGLVSLIAKAKAARVPDLISWLGDWLAKETANENAKRYPSEGRLDNLQDRHDCILAFCEGQSEVAGVLARINSVFTENKDARGITLASIHKAKGLEARRVFWLQPKGVGPRLDKMQRWELEQEDNLKYVATTRAIEELTHVV